ncbi:MAG: FapA family protein [bacterium]|nr:FapA family protein [bacterium]
MEVDQLKPDMITNETIILPGTKIILLTKGNKITERVIANLLKWKIMKVDVEIPEKHAEGQKHEELETLRAASRIEGDTLIFSGDIRVKDHRIEFSSNVKVEGNLLEGTVIDSEKDIIITGKVIGGSLYCRGNILIMNGIEGKSESVVEAEGDIKAAYVRDARVYSRHGSIYIDFDITSSEVKARKNLLVGVQKGLLMLNDEFRNLKKGAIESGIITVGEELEAYHLGNERKEQLRIQVINYDLMNIGNELIRLETELLKNLIEFRQIEKAINLIKVLGRNIVSLPEEKKQELKNQSDRYFKLKNNITEMNQARNLLLKEKVVKNNRLRDYAYIKVFDKVYPGVTISIDQMKLEVHFSQKKVAFYKKGMIIMAKLEEEPV